MHFEIGDEGVPVGNAPQPPPQVCRFCPSFPKALGIRVAAGFPSGRKALPSRFNSASNLPGPQFISTFSTAARSTPSACWRGVRFGAAATIAPTFRS
jgi:hypothetical protein